MYCTYYYNSFFYSKKSWTDLNSVMGFGEFALVGANHSWVFISRFMKEPIVSTYYRKKNLFLKFWVPLLLKPIRGFFTKNKDSIQALKSTIVDFDLCFVCLVS